MTRIQHETTIVSALTHEANPGLSNFYFFMNKKLLALYLGAFLSCSLAYAQPLQLSNGDTLGVEITYYTDSTITFVHPILGQQTVAKTGVSNIAELNLDKVTKLPEGEAGKAIIAANVAKKALVPAKQEVDQANKELIVAQNNLKLADESQLDAAEQQVKDAATKVEKAEKKLIAAADAVEVADNYIVVASEVSHAEAQVTAAKNDVKAANNQVVVAKAEAKATQKKFEVAEQAMSTTKAAGVMQAEEKVATAKTRAEIASEHFELAEVQVQEAEENVVVAENNVKRAKGKKVNVGFMGTGWFKGWDSSLAIGLSGASGSSVNNTFRTAFNTRYEDKKGRWVYRSFYYRDSEDNVTGENQINATLVKDWFFNETKWFAFVTGVYDWNQFKDWHHRLQFGGGPGYQFIKTDQWEFSGRTGLTLITEFGKTQYNANGGVIFNPDGSVLEDTVVGLEGLIGADVTWHITAQQHFSISNYFYPSLTHSGEFRNLTNISWIHSLDWFESLALKFGIRNEYDTSDSIPNEFNYNFSVLWGF